MPPPRRPKKSQHAGADGIFGISSPRVRRVVPRVVRVDVRELLALFRGREPQPVVFARVLLDVRHKLKKTLSLSPVSLYEFVSVEEAN